MRIRGYCASALCMCIWLATSAQVGYADTKGGGENKAEVLAAKRLAQEVADSQSSDAKATDSVNIEPASGGAPRGVSGACCNPFDGTCEIQPSLEVCDLFGGSWQGAGTSCSPNPCDQPLDCFSISPNGTLVNVPPALIANIDLSPSDENNNNVALEYFNMFSFRYVTQIRWWGVYSQGTSSCTPNAHQFRIRIFGDANGPGGGPSMPGARVICEEVVTVTPLFTGQNISGAREIREFNATIPQCAIGGDGWIEIQAVDDGGTCIFNWVSGDNPGSLDGMTSLLNGQQVQWDLSLCLATSNLNTPTGACCDDDTGTCQDNVQYDICVTTNPLARFTADTTCVNVDPPCGQVTGACCATFSDGGGAFEEGDCLVTTSADCANTFGGGGVWSGAFTDCSPNPCQGACCLGDGTCVEATANECIGQGGQHFGDGTECATTACPGTGRCCYNLGTECAVVTEAACTANFGGVFTADITCQVACPIPPTNDECNTAIDIPCGTNVTVDNTTATENALDPAFSCHAGGADTGFGSIWFTFTATDTTAFVQTCSSEVGDTLLAVYDGSCGGLVEIACSEDDCGAAPGFLSELCAENLVIGNTYIIQAATFGDAGRGAITVQVDCPCPSGACCSDAGCTILTPQSCATSGGTYLGDDLPCNPNSCDGACCFADGTCTDLSSGDCAAQAGFFEGVGTFCANTVCPIRPTNLTCDQALLLNPATDLPYSQVLGFEFATSDGPAGSCDTVSVGDPMQNDLWWEITPTENCQLRVTVTPLPGFDPIIVLRDSCIPGNEIACADLTDGGAVEQLEAILTMGVTYFIQIGDTGAAPGGGDATVDIICGQVGSCCLPNNMCVINQETDCIGLGGSFGGADTDCGFQGACCLPGLCVTTSRDCCIAGGGAYVGDGTSCGDVAGTPVTYDAGAVNLPIDEAATPTLSDLSVPDTGTVADVNLTFDITHTFQADLDIDLIHAGITVRVMEDQCGGNDNIAVTFDDEAPTAIVCAAPTTGTFQPLNALSAFDGSDRAGIWTLSVFDDAGGDQGTLNTWQIAVDGLGVSPCDAGTGACCVDTMTCTPNQTVAQCSAAGGTFLGVGSICDAGACDIMGACCNNITGGCTVESEANCISGNGTYQGDFSNCTTVSCPIILGACCNADASCSDGITFDTCTNAGGAWQGPSTVCGDIRGACCLTGGFCIITTQDCCANSNGSYVGDFTDCGAAAGAPQTFTSSPNLAIPDNVPAGVNDSLTVPNAFTIGDVNVSVNIPHTWIGDLIIIVEHNGTQVNVWDEVCDTDEFIDLNATFDDSGVAVACASPTTGFLIPSEALSVFNGMNASGTWNINVSDNTGADTGTLVTWSVIIDGVGTSPCEGGTGACCTSTTTCIPNQTVQECSMAGGTYLGLGTTCEPGICDIMGACCDIVTSACTVQSETDCINNNGVYQGDFTNCSTVMCPIILGACCNADGTCTNAVTFTVCTNAGGAWQGPSSQCDTITGACCLTGGLCLVTSQDCCLNAGGAYVGDGTNCGASAGNPMSYPSGAIGQAIDSTLAPVVTSVNVPDTFTVGDVNVQIDLLHTFVGDICVTLEHNGTIVELIQRSGADNGSGTCHTGSPFGCASNDYSIELDDEGTGGSIEDLCGATTADPTPGSPPNYLPFEALSAFDGMSSAGTWTLTVLDNAAGDVGTMNSWTLVLDGVGMSPCDSGTGACCLSPTNCVADQTLQECSMAGGTYLGLGSTCQPGVCDIMGACCDNITGGCTVESEADCISGNGTYQGDFSNCSTVNCPIVLGACCNADATCTPNVTFDNCTGAGGSWQGPNSQCSTVLGACCLPGGTTCIVTSEACCTAAGGGYVGDGTNCGEAAGTPVLYDAGAVNLPIDEAATPTLSDLNVPDSGTVGDVDLSFNITHTFQADLDIDLIHGGVTVRVMEDQCGGNNDITATFDDEAPTAIVCAEPTVGTFQPLNALSAFDGTDKLGIWTLSVFDDAGGDQGTLNNWQLSIDGVGMNPCDNNPGACCLPNETCVENQTPVECSQQGGSYQGAASTCAGVDCTIQGACCNVTDGSCRLVDDGVDCNLAGEVYQGDNTTCAGVTCPVERGACCLPNASCVANLTVGECEVDNGGVWQGNGSACSTTTGACCLPTSCVVTNSDCCTAAGGAYQGDGTSCGAAAGNPTPYSSAPALAIPDDGSISDTINVPDSVTIGDVDVVIDIAHTWVGDLTITLEHVNSGTTATLFMEPDGGGFSCPDANLNVTMDDEGTGGAVNDQCIGDFASNYPTSPPSFTPFSPLSVFDGLDSASNWRLTVADGAAGDTGSIVSWTVLIDGIGPSICDQTGDCECPGDVNGDGSINGLDIQAFNACLLSGAAGCECADINNSGDVTMSDVPLFVNVLLNGSGPCDGGSGGVCTTCPGDANGDSIIDSRDLDMYMNNCLLGGANCPCTQGMTLSDMINALLNSTGMCP